MGRLTAVVSLRYLNTPGVRAPPPCAARKWRLADVAGISQAANDASLDTDAEVKGCLWSVPALLASLARVLRPGRALRQ
jgi:hypothetical protein